MKTPTATPSRYDLDANRTVPFAEHRAWLKVCALGFRLGTALHGDKRNRNPEKAESLLQQIVATHDLNDGSIFCCALCWEIALSYKRTGRFAMPEKTERVRGTREDFEYIQLHWGRHA